MARKLFCEMNPVFYEISRKKEITKRKIKNVFGKEKIAKKHLDIELPNIVKSHSSILLRKLHGVDMQLQENKITNIELACKKVNKLVIHPGETFSYWKTIGEPTKRKGYKKGLVISKKGMKSGYGGGLCQMGNMIHWLVLNSPLEVTELHHHSDALFPDVKRRVPFGTGTSISYKALDYRFKNTTQNPIQIRVWLDDTFLYGEIRSIVPLTQKYKIVEEDNHYAKDENGVFYRNSKVYRIIIDKETGKEIKKELILNNHSKVMYDYSLIPENEIREEIKS